MKAPDFIPALVQLLLTLGQLRSPQGDAAMRTILMSGPPARLRFDAAISGLRSREVDFLDQLVNDPICTTDKAEHAPLVSGLARAITLDRLASRLDALLGLVARRKTGDWQQIAMLDGMISTLPAPPKDGRSTGSAPKVIRFPSEPAGWAGVKKLTEAEVQTRVARLEPLLAWPGHNDAALPKVVPLSAAEQESFVRGKDLYGAICAACHQPHGD